jgi:putative ABC transport system permease protein
MLSVLGLYAVIAYSVSQRTHEIGIRMAIGASAGRVLGMVLKQGLVLSIIGVSIGLALTFALSTLLREMLNGVNPRDPTIYASGTAVLLAVTLAASWLPARRASHVDPQAALRAE